jgi:hypothetical protein
MRLKPVARVWCVTVSGLRGRGARDLKCFQEASLRLEPDACRHHGQAYGSQFETSHDRALSAAQDIRHELGGKNHISLLELPPPKPKGMQGRTYEARINRLKSYETICSQYEMMLFARLHGRI